MRNAIYNAIQLPVCKYFRSQGDTRTPLICLAISGLVNVALNLLFVIVVGMDVEGVAIATVIADVLSSSLLFYF